MPSTKRTSVLERGQLLRLDRPQDDDPRRQQHTKKPRKEVRPKPELVPANWLVRPDLLLRLKRHALDRRMKLYEVLNEALDRYLSDDPSHGAPR